MDWPSPPPTSPSLVVRSPRQTVGLLRNRPAGDHGPKPSEVYGFVGSITTVIAIAVYLAWAYTPEPWLHSLGITYYPSKYWALAVPSFVIVAVALSMAIYMGFNFLATPPPTSFNTIFGETEVSTVFFSIQFTVTSFWSLHFHLFFCILYTSASQCL
ncbi:hypothetical protein PR202_ga18569 [Eleusine coracana subsp. coracana]|uniref:PIG-P domain-containing protein n=1 Tax=Eleusine coracana subsp. coracana TaxID=191504 RepID=A0AAV5CTN6_ELECO|nr:hypothetical protein PR202_ga18569 [Eleusine coracana subsp. coracana]